MKKVKDLKDILKTYLGFLALPWCCVIPVLFSLLGLSSIISGAVLMSITPILLVISIGFLGYANYWIYSGKCMIKRNKIIVQISTIVAILLWTWSFFRMGWLKI